MSQVISWFVALVMNNLKDRSPTFTSSAWARWATRLEAATRWEPWLSRRKLALPSPCFRSRSTNLSPPRASDCWFGSESGVNPHVSTLWGDGKAGCYAPRAGRTTQTLRLARQLRRELALAGQQFGLWFEGDLGFDDAGRVKCERAVQGPFHGVVQRLGLLVVALPLVGDFVLRAPFQS